MEIEKIGKKIRQRRRALKVTQNDLSEIANISLRSIKAMESGICNPRFSQLEKILDALGLAVSIEERLKDV